MMILTHVLSFMAGTVIGIILVALVSAGGNNDD